jgi:transcriptional regulator with XRE-family HTH domain
MQRIDSDTVAGEVRANLARRGKTKVWLAAQLKISTATLQRRLAGQSSFSLAEISTIAEALDVPVSDLLPGVAA